MDLRGHQQYIFDHLKIVHNIFAHCGGCEWVFYGVDWPVYPILTISDLDWLSRNLERSYPRSESSRKSVSSVICLSSAPKTEMNPTKCIEQQVIAIA